MIHYGFDGWLFNVENRIDPDKIPFLVDFVNKLTKATKQVERPAALEGIHHVHNNNLYGLCFLVSSNSTVETRAWSYGTTA